MTTCQIKWVDDQGNPTSDSNEAIGRVRLPTRTEFHHGRYINYTETEWFCICSEHAKQLTKPGMEKWQFECIG